MIAGKILNPSFTTSFYDNTTHHIASEANGWNLILVNRDNYIPDDYKVQLTELSNGKKVDSRIYPELQEMFDAAREQGYGLFVREGYRTQEEQQQLLDEKIEAYENDGKSKSEAKRLAEQWVAIPGTSEHQLGIAVDINADTTKSSSDDVYNWLAENAHTYGFIKRYPSNKTDITGVINDRIRGTITETIKRQQEIDRLTKLAKCYEDGRPFPATAQPAATRNPNGFANFKQTDMSNQLDKLEQMLADELNLDKR